MSYTLVVVPVGGKADQCLGCEWEFDGDDVKGDFCGLFNELKETGIRCMACHRAEVANVK